MPFDRWSYRASVRYCSLVAAVTLEQGSCDNQVRYADATLYLSMVNRSDAALLAAWGDGDQEAGRTLFGRHFDPMYRFVSSKVPTDVDDVVQEIFIAALEARARFRGDSSFRTFLYAIARNTLFAYYRRERRLAKRFEPLETSAHDLAPTPSSLIGLHEERKILMRVLRSLPLDVQIAMELYYFEELSAREVSVVLDVPEGTVRSRLRRGLQLAQAAVEEGIADQALLRSTLGGLSRWREEIEAVRLGGHQEKRE